MTLLHAAQPESTLTYPTKPIRFLVPYAPGAGTDTAARTLSAKLTERWNQQIIVDNRSGASGALAVEAAVNANPDGHDEVEQWYGIATPVKVRKPIVAALHAAFAQSLQAPEVVQRLTADGSALVGSTPEQFGDLIKSEIAKWTKLVKAANIQMQ